MLPTRYLKHCASWPPAAVLAISRDAPPHQQFPRGEPICPDSAPLFRNRVGECEVAHTLNKKGPFLGYGRSGLRPSTSVGLRRDLAGVPHGTDPGLRPDDRRARVGATLAQAAKQSEQQG